MSKVEDFLTKAEEQEIVEAIRLAEKETSGEIRVHIESTTTLVHFERAKVVFQDLKMHETNLKNGVLIYIAVNDKKFIICGDQGINEKVPENFWESTQQTMQRYFKNTEYKNGIVAGIEMTGKQLKNYFPYLENDCNELSNEISIGK